MEASPTNASPLYLMERFDVGIVQLDAERRVVGMNGFARRVLPVEQKQPFDRMVLSFHPERSQPKVEFMLDQAAQCPVSNPPPMTMIINIPERVLLIKVSRMSDAANATCGYTLVFYDITELVSADDSAQPRTEVRRRLLKLPIVNAGQIALVDVDEVRGVRSDGHYTQVLTDRGPRFCNLGIGDIGERLDPEQFMRVHRSHIVNLHSVDELLRDDGRLSIRLRGEEKLVPVSRSASPALLERLGVQPGVSAVRQG